MGALYSRTINESGKQPQDMWRTRKCKGFHFWQIYNTANYIHRNAIGYANPSDVERWKELILPVNEWLKPRFLLFLAPTEPGSVPSPADWKIFFFTFLFCFPGFVGFYCGWNPSDKYQYHALVAAVLGGLLLTLSLEVGVWTGLLCIVPRAVLLGLLFSDIVHALARRLWRKTVQSEQVAELKQMEQGTGEK